MPIYEYECPSCGRIFEEWVKVSEAHSEEACRSCGTPSPRVMSQTSFVLKGQGWYVTEYGYRKNVKEDGEKKAQTTDEKKETASEKDTQTKAADGASKEKSAETGKESQKSSGEASQQNKSVSSTKTEKASKDTAAPKSGGGSAKKSA